jgi:DNA-directed RNA polymerase specialized sigma24 family protein
MLKLRRISALHRDVFLERYEGLHSWAIQITANDRALAEDLLHDLFILFTLSQPDLARIENLDNYLYASLRNLHVSQLRRTTRGRFEQLSIVEYESAKLSLHSIGSGRDLIQAQDELRRICHYACARKATANAASVLILRFFHGYYPSEIARVMRSTRQAVDVRLRAARTEAKAYLENSKSLTFMSGSQASVTPEVFPARFARAAGDFLLELQQTIFDSRQGECLDLEELSDLYASGRQGPLSRKHLTHIVSCPVCLDTVNNLLGLSLLAERYPTDTMDKDNKKGGGPPDDGGKGGAVRRLKEWEREARDAFEHKPQELCVSVNGYLLGSQLIGAELSELTLNVAADERISFCEVFSEQGIRLMMMNVDELPPNGPGELRERVSLSEARTLESALLFSNPFPTLHVTYHDPALAVEAATDIEFAEAGEVSTGPTPQDSRIKRLRLSSPIKKLDKPISAIVQALRSRFLNLHFWARPASLTALIAIVVIAAVVFLELRGPAPVVTAADLLQRSTLAEEALASNREQVLHRTINLEEKTASSGVIARRRIEVWQSAASGVSARRLFDEKGALIAGDWRRADGVRTLYSHSSRPQIKSVPEKQGAVTASLSFENAWQFLPSAKDFTSLVGGPENVRVEQRASDYLISYSRDESGAQADGVLKVALILSRTDLHATEQSFTLRQGNEVREYRMMEASFERRPPSTVAPSVFEPDAELLNSGLSLKVVPTNNDAKDSASKPATPVRVVATAELEVEVLRLLNQAGADMGEQVSVTRTSEGLLQVQGLTQTDKRKRELLSALSSLAGNPAVKLNIQTLDEALARRPKDQISSNSITVETTQPSSNTIAVDQELRQYFARRNVPEAQTEEAIRQFGDRTLRRSLQVLMHAAAMKALAQRFSPEELRTLDSDAKAKWLLLIRRHAQALQEESAVLRREVAPVFPVVVAQNSNETAEIQSDVDLARAAQRLFGICSENDRAIRLAFSISPESSSDYAIKGAQFWRSLQNAEALAARVSQYHLR